MFQYHFCSLFMMFPDLDADNYGMNDYTKSIWDALRETNQPKFEAGMIKYIFHTTFKSTEVI